jgi:hypothetical protein
MPATSFDWVSLLRCRIVISLSLPTSECQESIEVVEKVASLVKKHSIPTRLIDLVSGPGSLASERRPTVMIEASAAESNLWYLLLKDIQEYFEAASLRDSMCLQLPVHFPVEEVHPIVPVWSNLLKDIVSVLDPHLWYSVSAVRRSHYPNTNKYPVTIVVTSKYPRQCAVVEPTLQLRCHHYGLEDIEVSFVQVDNILDANGSQAPDFPLSPNLNPGASIGLDFKPLSTGSLGGKVIVTRGITKHEVGVTIFRIVGPHQAIEG